MQMEKSELGGGWFTDSRVFRVFSGGLWFGGVTKIPLLDTCVPRRGGCTLNECSCE